MAEALVRSESPTEYFRELVESAMQHQRLTAGEHTSFYIVNLLTGCLHIEDNPPQSRVDFQDRAKNRLDLDFSLKPTPSGDLEVTEIKIHKVNGAERK